MPHPVSERQRTSPRATAAPGPDGHAGIGRRLGRLVLRLPAFAVVLLIRVYQVMISPLLPAACRYTPSCSAYAVEAVERYGALRGGACGFLLKDSGPTLLAEAIRAAAAGDALVSPSVTVRLLKHLTADAQSEAPARPAPPTEPLTDRELDVVRLVALGRTNAEIAAELYVSLSTVKTHLSSVQLKLAARNRVEIAAWAWQNGYAQPGA